MSDLPTDEARWALENQVADIIRRHVWGRVNGDAAELLGFHAAAAEVLASLRAKTAGGAEEMRERAAALCDEEARDQHNLAVAALSSDTQASDTAYGAEEAARTLASAIRSLPLDPSPQREGGGE